MKSVVDILDDRISEAMARVTGRQDCAAIVRPATDPKFGDYQANGVMALAKQIKTNPRKLAESVVEQLDLSDICEPPEIAGPGFINLRLKPEYVAGELLRIAGDKQDRLGIEKVAEPQTIVVDFSSPNVAKHMHVGHLRSTIIGDAICRLLKFLGHNVIRQNHIGNWGTQFGILIARLEATHASGILHDANVRVSVRLQILEDTYKAAQSQYNSDPEFAKDAHNWVVRLQNYDPDAIAYWKDIVHLSLDACQELYKTLNTTLTRDDVRGESEYNEMLPAVVEDLKQAGLAQESEGAVCVFPPGFRTKEGQPLPFIIQKSDGAYLYATTDLAALRYRVNMLRADRIIYVTDARQIQHFQMLFKVAEMAGWDRHDSKKIELVHVTFGSILHEDGTPLQTRSGMTIKLEALLDEAVERAKDVVDEKSRGYTADERRKITEAVGVGAVKYADYSNNRTSDYVFSFDKMLAMDGNTAPYMQYAYARVMSIKEKGKSRGIPVEEELAGVQSLVLDEPAELDLAKHLVRYAEAVESAADEYRPNCLTSYLYELAQKFSAFYTECPVLDAPPGKRPTRLLLCDLTADTIKHGLSRLLGIAVVEQM